MCSDGEGKSIAFSQWCAVSVLVLMVLISFSGLKQRLLDIKLQHQTCLIHLMLHLLNSALAMQTCMSD